MTATSVEQWLSDVIGLDAHTLGPQAVANAVKRRMAACGLTRESDYLERLNKTHDELPSLIDLIVVPETWFFRDREPFVFLAQQVSLTWLAAHPHALLQVLSVPCSTGEEPYSIAMALQSAGLPPTRYRIDAVDINAISLCKAQKGAYGPNSFRSGLLEHCERYFQLEGATRIVSPEVRANIRFIQGNIMGTLAFFTEQTYDVIFCRNLLIYQHMEARRHIIAKLDRLLKPHGLLFVGHAEMMSLLADRYEPVHHSGAFAYCKMMTKPCHAAPESVDSHPQPRSNQDRVPQPKWRDARSHPTPTIVGPQPACNAVRSTAGRLAEAIIPLEPTSRLEPASRLDCVRALADQGRLDEATAMCQSLLKDNPQLAEAHFLMGMIHTAAGQIQAAEECLNRALYLDTDFHEALIHLSLLKDRCGDEAGAERLRRRAERVRDHAQVTP